MEERCGFGGGGKGRRKDEMTEYVQDRKASEVRDLEVIKVFLGKRGRPIMVIAFLEPMHLGQGKKRPP